MSDDEFQRLEKAEQDVLAQISKQKKVCDDLTTEFRSLRDDFLESYNETYRPLRNSLQNLAGDSWNAHRSRLDKVIASCSIEIDDKTTSEDIGRLQNSRKAQTKEALGETDATVRQFEEMSVSLRRLETLVQGRDSEDFLRELQIKKQRLEQEEERLKVLQDRYDRYFGDRNRKGSA